MLGDFDSEIIIADRDGGLNFNRVLLNLGSVADDAIVFNF